MYIVIENERDNCKCELQWIYEIIFLISYISVLCKKAGKMPKVEWIWHENVNISDDSFLLKFIPNDVYLT